MTPFIQGAIAAATTACLYRQITQAEEKQPTWENITLAANHLFHVVNAALIENRIKSSTFTLCAKTVFYLTPVALISSFYANRKITPKEKSFSKHFSRFYYLAAAASLALIAFRKKEFGIGAFSVLALDAAVHHKQCPKIIRKVFMIFCETAAISVFAYFWQALTTVERQATMTVIGLAVFGPKIVAMLPEEDTSDEGEIRGKVRYSEEYKRFLKRNVDPCRYYPHHHCSPVYYGGGSAPPASAPRKEEPSFMERVGAAFLPNHLEAK